VTFVGVDPVTQDFSLTDLSGLDGHENSTGKLKVFNKIVGIVVCSLPASTSEKLEVMMH